MSSHRCDERCTCPRCGEPLYFHTRSEQHACSDRVCPWSEPDWLVSWLEHRRQERAASDRLIEQLLGYAVIRPVDDGGTRGPSFTTVVIDEAVDHDAAQEDP